MSNKTFSSQLFLEELQEKTNPSYFQNELGETYVSQIIDGVLVTTKIESIQTQQLIRRILNECGITGRKEDKIQDVIEEMKTRAVLSKTRKKVYIRYGFDSKNRISLDLCDGKGTVIIIENGDFTITTDHDVTFLRPTKQLPLPTPVRSEDFMERLSVFLNLEKSGDIILLVVLLIKICIPNSGANPFLLLMGNQGTGKTTLSKFLKGIIDPSSPMACAPPRDERELIAMLSWGFLVLLDNLSGMNHLMADNFCRIATGGGFSQRALFKDDELKSYIADNRFILNGIEEVSSRPDFLERAITIRLKIIVGGHKSENELNEEFKKQLPYLLGGFLLLLARVVEILPQITRTGLPRMTEYARVGIALEKVLNLPEGTFLSAYEANLGEKSQDSFWNDEVCVAIHKCLIPISSPFPEMFSVEEKEELKGSALEIRDRLFERKKNTPFSRFSGRKFSSYLDRITPLLEKNGITVERLPRASKVRGIVIKRKSKAVNKQEETGSDLL